MNKTLLVIVSVLTVITAACSHNPLRGSVAMKIDTRNAEVCMGHDEVKKGDRVRLYQNVCTPNPHDDRRVPNIHCKKILIGGGSVTETVDAHYSQILVDEGVQFTEGTIVEGN